MAHTPGPWDAQGMVVVALSADSVIHLPASSAKCSNDELRANARLIAAAPDLLAVLASLREDFDVHHAHGTGANRSTIADWTARVTAAIQSATGAEQ